jgi:hypothetical protein
MHPADFWYTDHDINAPNGYLAVAKELQQHKIEGDTLMQSLVVVVHWHLLATDLSYGNGERWLHVDEEDWNNPPADIGFGFVQTQTFYYGLVRTAGYLPNYRLMAMDCSSSYCKLMLDEPAPSSCIEMANSLREMLKLYFTVKYIDNDHSRKQQSLSAQEFCINADKTWNWLDGKSLLADLK